MLILIYIPIRLHALTIHIVNDTCLLLTYYKYNSFMYKCSPEYVNFKINI